MYTDTNILQQAGVVLKNISGKNREDGNIDLI